MKQLLNSIMIKMIIIGVIITLISSLIFNITTSILLGFIPTVYMVVRVWIRETPILFGKDRRYRKIVIWKGFHRPFPWFVFHPFIINRDKSFTLYKVIRFTEKSLYDNEDNKYDISKLFGFFIGHPHTNSYRWGNYVDTYNNEYVTTYEYIDGNRQTKQGVKVDLNTNYHLYIRYNNGIIQYIINDTVIHSTNIELPKYSLAWKLGTYFDGTYTAPHTIEYLTL